MGLGSQTVHKLISIEERPKKCKKLLVSIGLPKSAQTYFDWGAAQKMQKTTCFDWAPKQCTNLFRLGSGPKNAKNDLFRLGSQTVHKLISIGERPKKCKKRLVSIGLPNSAQTYFVWGAAQKMQKPYFDWEAVQKMQTSTCFDWAPKKCTNLF